MHRRVVRGDLLPAAGRLRLEELLALGPELDHGRDLHLRALDLAQELKLAAAYDARYLALAEREGCECWTADERLWNSVKARLPWVRWVGELRPRTPPPS